MLPSVLYKETYSLTELDQKVRCKLTQGGDTLIPKNLQVGIDTKGTYFIFVGTLQAHKTTIVNFDAPKQ